MGRLRNLEVQRVDGVGSPASGHRFIIIKSSNETVEKAAAIEKAAGDALTALLKEAGLQLSKEAAEALTALAQALEVEGEFTAKAEDAETDPAEVEKDGDDPAEGDDEPEGEETPAADDAPASDDDSDDVEKTYTAAEAEELVKKALDMHGVDVATVEKGIELGTTRLGNVAKSRQPRTEGGDARSKVKKGDGLFEDVIFG